MEVPIVLPESIRSLVQQTPTPIKAEDIDTTFKSNSIGPPSTQTRWQKFR